MGFIKKPTRTDERPFFNFDLQIASFKVVLADFSRNVATASLLKFEPPNRPF